LVGSDDDTVGLHEVLDGGAFLEEFGVGDDIELALAPRPARVVVISLRTLSAVPTGTVDFVMTMQYRFRWVAIVRAAPIHSEDRRTVLIGRGPHGNELKEPVSTPFTASVVIRCGLPRRCA